MSETARLRWLCRRGMRELDMLVSRYLEERYAEASPAHQAAFRDLLELQDPELNALLLGREMPREGALADVVAEIRRIAQVRA